MFRFDLKSWCYLVRFFDCGHLLPGSGLSQNDSSPNSPQLDSKRSGIPERVFPEGRSPLILKRFLRVFYVYLRVFYVYLRVFYVYVRHLRVPSVPFKKKIEVS